MLPLLLACSTAYAKDQLMVRDLEVQRGVDKQTAGV
jgi:hypothetical protein